MERRREFLWVCCSRSCRVMPSGDNIARFSILFPFESYWTSALLNLASCYALHFLIWMSSRSNFPFSKQLFYRGFYTVGTKSSGLKCFPNSTLLDSNKEKVSCYRFGEWIERNSSCKMNILTMLTPILFENNHYKPIWFCLFCFLFISNCRCVLTCIL